MKFLTSEYIKSANPPSRSSNPFAIHFTLREFCRCRSPPHDHNFHKSPSPPFHLPTYLPHPIHRNPSSLDIVVSLYSQTAISLTFAAFAFTVPFTSVYCVLVKGLLKETEKIRDEKGAASLPHIEPIVAVTSSRRLQPFKRLRFYRDSTAYSCYCSELLEGSITFT